MSCTFGSNKKTGAAAARAAASFAAADAALGLAPLPAGTGGVTGTGWLLSSHSTCRGPNSNCPELMMKWRAILAESGRVFARRGNTCLGPEQEDGNNRQTWLSGVNSLKRPHAGQQQIGSQFWREVLTGEAINDNTPDLPASGGPMTTRLRPPGIGGSSSSMLSARACASGIMDTQLLSVVAAATCPPAVALLPVRPPAGKHRFVDDDEEVPGGPAAAPQSSTAHQVWRIHQPQPQAVQAEGRLLVELVVGAGLATGQSLEAGDPAAGLPGLLPGTSLDIGDPPGGRPPLNGGAADQLTKVLNSMLSSGLLSSLPRSKVTVTVTVSCGASWKEDWSSKKGCEVRRLHEMESGDTFCTVRALRMGRAGCPGV
ncbi:MAG: hypothetical protein FRX49_04144 [Trebouxia sp. A1-2]|nr:MAG: hypothetical protein FRX49_04144 [Trebouxia sp. A1-2]